MDTSLRSFWIAFGVAAVLAYPIYMILLRMKSRQIIDQFAPETHQKKQGTPTMGGLIVVMGFVGACLGLLMTKPTSSEASFVYAALAVTLGFALIGFVDDFVVPRLVKGKRGLGWKQKIVMEFAVAYAGAGLLYGWTAVWPVLISMFFILFFANAYNFADGLDGLAGSLLIGLGAGFAALFAVLGATGPYLGLCFALIGAVIPFLYLNAHPAKIFMGDVGALPIGAVLGVFASLLLIRVSGAGFPMVWDMLPAVFILSFMMVGELVPVPLQVAYYKLTKGKRIFPSTPIHHAFEKKGWPETRVVWVFALTQGLLSVLAYTLVVNR